MADEIPQEIRQEIERRLLGVATDPRSLEQQGVPGAIVSAGGHTYRIADAAVLDTPHGVELALRLERLDERPITLHVVHTIDPEEEPHG